MARHPGQPHVGQSNDRWRLTDLIMLTPSQAAKTILSSITPLEVEEVPLPQTLDRVLAGDVASPIDLPPWDNSAMDGYAVLADNLPRGDGADVSLELKVIETVPAGGFPTCQPGRGECSRILTGAPMPPNTDSVIRQEDTTRIGEDRIRVNDVRDLGRNVRMRGEDISEGSTVLAHGSPLDSSQIGVLASIARDTVAVYRKPVVAILATGDEIADLDERDAILAGKKIASSNTYTMLSLVDRAAATPLNLGIAKDDPDDLRNKLEQAAAADLIVTSAGVSVGEHDYVRTVLIEMGSEMKFWRIGMRPGAPVGYGLLKGKPWLGLPGNPVSTMVTFELFARPAIRKMLGHKLLFRRAIELEVCERIELRPELKHFLRVTIEHHAGKLRARLTGPQGSGILTSMAKADALLIVPEEKQIVEEGELLRAIVLDDPIHVADPPY